MMMSRAVVAHYHEDPAFFRDAISLTEARTSFPARLVEKDYFCSLVIAYLASVESLVFKGGTCLAKVHADFYRLSEDLDYVIPIAMAATRRQRSLKAAIIKEKLGGLPKHIPGMTVIDPLVGANDSKQYLAAVGYASLLTGQTEPIKIEVGLREPLLLPPVMADAATILLDSLTAMPLLTPIRIRCIAAIEAYAEKMRAALSRREAAIRDFFDIDWAVRHGRLAPDDPVFLDLVRSKLAVPGNTGMDVSESRLKALRRQVEQQLKPVLRQADFLSFNLDRAFAIVFGVAAALDKRGASRRASNPDP